MKNEKALLALPFDDININIPKPEKVKEKTWYGMAHRTVYKHGYIAKKINDNILMVTVYDYKQKPRYRIFIGDHDYISQKKCTDGWHRSTAKISSLYNTSEYSWNREEFLTTEESRAAALSWLKSYKSERVDVFKRVADYVDDIGRQRTEMRHERIRKSVDEVMLQIRPLPKDFEKWADRGPFKVNRYILYQYSRKKQMDGYCSHCKAEVKVTNARHQGKGICPNCKSKVTYLASGKTSSFGIEKNLIYIQQGKDDEVIFRHFTYYKNFYNQGTKLDVSGYMCEESREFYKAEKAFEYCDRWNVGKFEFHNCGQHIYTRGYIYPYNVKKIFEKAARYCKHIQYIPYTQLLKHINHISGANFYTACVKYPQIEYLAKLKLYKLCREIINGDYSICKPEQNIFEALAITKRDIPYVKKYNMGYYQIKYIYRLCQKYDFSALSELMRISKDSSNLADDIAKMLEHANYKTIHKYMEQQLPMYRDKYANYWCRMSDNELKEHILSDWEDYLENCVTLQWNLKDTKVMRPKNLIERHDAAVEIVKLKKSELEKENIRRRYYENIFDFGYSDKKFTVTMPRNIDDLKYEGDKMHHCVYTNYAARVAEGRSIILFIRANEKFYEPLATVEISPKTYEVVQIRGEHNRPVSEDVSKFFDKYKGKVLNRLKMSGKAA